MKTLKLYARFLSIHPEYRTIAACKVVQAVCVYALCNITTVIALLVAGVL